MLNLPMELVLQLSQYYQPLRMDYDIWIQSDYSFEEIKNQLRRVGVKHLPMSSNPIIINYDQESRAFIPKGANPMLQAPKRF